VDYPNGHYVLTVTIEG